MRPWNALTERGRARRLGPLAREALGAYGLVGARVRLLEIATSTIFRIDTADGRKLAMKVDSSQEHGDADLDVALAWLETLAAETELPVVRPVRTLGGAPYTHAEGPGVPGARRCVVYEWVPGRPLADRLTREGYARLGALMAALHDHAETFVPPHAPMRWDRIFYWPEAVDPVVVDDPAYAHLYTPARRRVIERVRERAEPVLAGLYERGTPRVIHADLHGWNVHVHRGGLHLLDFEDVMWGFPVQDVAITLAYYRENEQHPAWAAAFEEAYRARRAWPVDDPWVVEALQAARRAMFTNWVANQSPHEAAGFFEEAFARLERFLDAS